MRSTCLPPIDVRRALWLTLMALIAAALLPGWAAPADSPLMQADSGAPVQAPGDATDAPPAEESTDAETEAQSPDQPGQRGTALPGGANVAVVSIEGMIYGFTLDSLERRVQRAMDDGANLIVIELDTPGGTVDSAMRISRYLKNLPVPTVAWVNNQAYSAGILIASAADEIVMSPASATGDAAPISPGQELAATERAKVLSPILEEFRDNAAANGYDFALLHAMAELGIEVYEIEHTDTGERRFVNQADYAVMVQGQSIDEVQDRRRSQEEGIGPGINVATAEDRGQWQRIRQFHDGASLLTISQDRALESGISSATIADEQELQQYLNASSITRVDPTWSEGLAGFLTHPIVRGVLVIILLIGAYMEFQSPGLGAPGAVAALALLALLGAPMIVGLAEVWHILVFLIGLILLIVELMFFAGFGLLGVGGLVLMFVGLVLMAVPTGGGGGFGPINLPPAEMWEQVLQSGIFMILGLFGGFLGIFFIARHFDRFPLFSGLVLQDHQDTMQSASGATAAPAQPVSGDETLGEGHLQVGDTGRVVTELRPTGRVAFDGELVDVVSFGQWIRAGQQVRIAEIHGNRIVVEEQP